MDIFAAHSGGRGGNRSAGGGAFRHGIASSKLCFVVDSFQLLQIERVTANRAAAEAESDRLAAELHDREGAFSRRLQEAEAGAAERADAAAADAAAAERRAADALEDAREWQVCMSGRLFLFVLLFLCALFSRPVRLRNTPACTGIVVSHALAGPNTMMQLDDEDNGCFLCNCRRERRQRRRRWRRCGSGRRRSWQRKTPRSPPSRCAITALALAGASDNATFTRAFLRLRALQAQKWPAEPPSRLGGLTGSRQTSQFLLPQHPMHASPTYACRHCRRERRSPARCGRPRSQATSLRRGVSAAARTTTATKQRRRRRAPCAAPSALRRSSRRRRCPPSR